LNKKKIASLLLVLFSAALAHAEYYRVNVTRVGENLYKETTSDVIIVTRYCYAYLSYEDAILKYEPYAYDNMLVYDGGKQYCEVKEIR
jgi:hypothetical protein